MDLKIKIFILGNVAAGKSRLACRLSQVLQLPLVQVDQLEFNSDLTKKPLATVRESLRAELKRESWVLDGHGPLDLLPSLLEQADVIVLLDLPHWRHYWWLLKRQLRVFFVPRPELPQGAREWNWAHCKKLILTLQKQQKQMKPELIKILQRPEHRSKLLHIKSLGELNRLLKNPRSFLVI